MSPSEPSESPADGNPLSEESERAILEMVREQLERPNPPGVKVLYRRAMHFIDDAVRHLSLQQFNAKFPLQVKRRKAHSEGSQDRCPQPAEIETPVGEPAVSEQRTPGETQSVRESSAKREASQAGSQGEQQYEFGVDRMDLRQRVRSALLGYARLVARAESRAELAEVVPRVDTYVEEVMQAR